MFSLNIERCKKNVNISYEFNIFDVYESITTLDHKQSLYQTLLGFSCFLYASQCCYVLIIIKTINFFPYLYVGSCIIVFL